MADEISFILGPALVGLFANVQSAWALGTVAVLAPDAID